MQLDTKYFGRITYDPQDVLEFPNGLFGFEGEKRFLLLPFSGSHGNMLCLQSVASPSPAFILMNPFSLKPDYAPELSPEELKLMGVSSSCELCYYVMCVAREPVGESTVNLRCPVVVNPDLHRACQVILDTQDYHMRHRLDEFSNRGVG
ncbi:flagellar assembly protein FliW [Lawsonibacter sp. LCP25S3_G6]|uniref:flagellar assembly protein FliW n=1 Tax=unclassified Lawsonibacter TaxID=2617946 RepID=UPI003F987A39